MKIVADEQIPLLDYLFADSAYTLIKKPGVLISAADLVDADMLWVRTVTRVDANLLSHSKVRFVGTATTGIDHIDTHWLNLNNIAWGSAAGANSLAVTEYVLCCIAALRNRGILTYPILPNKRLRAGIIGVGRVGSLVAQSLELLGFEVLLNDPPQCPA